MIVPKMKLKYDELYSFHISSAGNRLTIKMYPESYVKQEGMRHSIVILIDGEETLTMETNERIYTKKFFNAAENILRKALTDEENLVMLFVIEHYDPNIEHVIYESKIFVHMEKDSSAVYFEATSCISQRTFYMNKRQAKRFISRLFTAVKLLMVDGDRDTLTEVLYDTIHEGVEERIRENAKPKVLYLREAMYLYGISDSHVWGLPETKVFVHMRDIPTKGIEECLRRGLPVKVGTINELTREEIIDLTELFRENKDLGRLIFLLGITYDI